MSDSSSDSELNISELVSVVDEMRLDLEQTHRHIERAEIVASSSSSSSSFSTEELSMHYKKWILGFVLVDFDIEYGQKVSARQPDTLRLSDEEESNIAFASFPDSISGERDVSYIYRVRRTCVQQQQASSSSSSSFSFSSSFSEADENGFVYGFVFFRQRRDSDKRRGYLQRSVVLLSTKPFVSLFERVVSVVGELYFEHGADVLRSALRAIDRWPVPDSLTPNKKKSREEANRSGGEEATTPLLVNGEYQLPILGSVLAYRVSESARRCLSGGERLYDAFQHTLSELWMLWELVLCGEPLLVMAGTPTGCCNAVLALLSLIEPALSFAGDYRPYFTIHDADFAVFSSLHLSAAALPPIVLGATNPFFLKAFGHWPNVLTLLPKGRGLRADNESGSAISSSERALILAELKRAASTPHVANRLLRRYFTKLTNRFLLPLKRYFATLMPLAKSINPFDERPPRIEPFNQPEFLERLAASSTIAESELASSTKRALLRLYSRFLRSANFTDWLRSESDAAQRRLDDIYCRQSLRTRQLPSLVRLHRPTVEQLQHFAQRLQDDDQEHSEQLEFNAHLITQYLSSQSATIRLYAEKPIK
jgi:Transport protein Avl9